MTDAVPTKGQLIAGRVLSGLVILFLLFDAGLKLASPETAIKYSPPGLGWPLDVSTMYLLGTLLLIPTILHIWRPTAILGAILITGYLGGAIATHVRINSPLFSHSLFGVYLGVMLWGGLWLRDPRVRALIPLSKGAAA
ncbi:DoxX family protein [Sphingopyxis sp. KK2]|uniref:DoxX family protein n=1 Tax=Sphingopyxis sp. KK2 TaxID=1855727 RepID=UPI00097E6AF0|nr:DoxX family protein [Sphingopyxis sp. KK2]